MGIITSPPLPQRGPESTTVVRQQRRKEVPVGPDPLRWAWGPPADETPAQRAVRLAEERDARLVSERIDEEMRKEKQEKHQNLKERPVKVILLGREGSEKAAFLQEFRELYAQQAWRRENLVWRAVVRLNLVRSVNKILDALGKAHRDPHVDELRTRLSPLRRAQRNLEQHLGLTAGGEMRAAAVSQLVQQGQRLEKAMKVVISSCDDITVLWGDDSVRAVLETHRILLNEHSKFFLDNIHRIMEQDYEPSDDDVSRIRSRTVPGVQEHHYLLDTGPRRPWVFYDVGYRRTEARRVSWIRYLMEANALIFLASLSVFDQFLEDYRRINCLEDTYMLWTGICKSRLISEMDLILVLSGCDDLGIKLERGVRLNQYITSYGDRPNDQTSAIKYFRAHFKGVYSKNSVGSGSRSVYIHSTATAGPDRLVVRKVVANVRDSIQRDHLRDSKLL